MFLRALAAAPAIAQKMAEEAVGAAVDGAVAGGGDLLAGVPSAIGISGHHGKMLQLVALSKTGLLPDWVKRQAVRSTSQWDRRLDPDVASLQSVSLSAKIRISAARRLERAWASLEQDALDHKMMAEFMGWRDEP
jgi:hypothetical protein